MSLEIVSLHGVATVQGAPTTGLRRYGVPPGGAFDRESLALANALLGNAPDAPGVELALAAACGFRARTEIAVAVVGAEAVLSVGGGEEVGGSFTLRPGAAVGIGFPTRGARVYLALAGGVASSSPVPGGSCARLT